MSDPSAPRREPMFNMPASVIFLIGTLIAIYAGQNLILGRQALIDLELWFGFNPARLTNPGQVPGGMLPLFWTPVTYAFLHASWPHVLLNSAWLAIFGTPVARRYGGLRFFVVFVFSSIVGAFGFALVSPDFAVLVGASGGISGLTGLAVRFIFQPLVWARHPVTDEPVPVGRKLASIREVFAETRARSLTIIWLALNALTPFLPIFVGMSAEIAWQAHIAGFLAGFFIAPLIEEWARRDLARAMQGNES